MTTQNQRINITLESDVLDLLSVMAVKERKSVSGMAKTLILDALERHEDLALFHLVSMREAKGEKRIAHDGAWK
ncbi:MAG: hypothetical protein AAB276_00800 [Pseudomonadota bacterium]